MRVRCIVCSIRWLFAIGIRAFVDSVLFLNEIVKSSFFKCTIAYIQQTLVATLIASDFSSLLRCFQPGVD